MANEEPGLDGGGGRGQLQAAGEDGPDPRPGLGTLPTHEFHVPGLLVLNNEAESNVLSQHSNCEERARVQV